jgi:hypothetical protein
VAFLVGLAFAGLGGGTLAAAVGGVVFGLAYLIQNQIRRRRATFVAPPPKTPAEKARSDARLLRGMAICNLFAAATAVAVAATKGDQWLWPSGWTPLMLMAAACGVTSAPHLWALAEWREYQKTNRAAWALAGVLDIFFGVAAAVIAITNLRSDWIGGAAWTLALAVLAALFLVGAPDHLRRTRA